MDADRDDTVCVRTAKHTCEDVLGEVAVLASCVTHNKAKSGCIGTELADEGMANDEEDRVSATTSPSSPPGTLTHHSACHTSE